jgi:hypothetical protein
VEPKGGTGQAVGSIAVPKSSIARRIHGLDDTEPLVAIHWSFAELVGIHRVIESSPEYEEELTTTEVCLPFNMEYKLSIVDAYGDGLCCDYGEGFYKVLDDQDNELFGGRNEFSEEESFIEVIVLADGERREPSHLPSRTKKHFPK